MLVLEKALTWQLCPFLGSFGYTVMQFNLWVSLSVVNWQETNATLTALVLPHRYGPSYENKHSQKSYRDRTWPSVTRFPCRGPSASLSQEGHVAHIEANYCLTLLRYLRGDTRTQWHCVSDKCSAKTKRSGRGSGSNQAPSALNSTRKPKLRSSPAWTWGKWFSSQRERTSVTGLPSTLWISLTGSTWSTARWASSAPSAPVPSCLGGWGTSTGGKMETSTRSPPSSLPWSTWTCWWTGSSRSSITRTSSPPE